MPSRRQSSAMLSSPRSPSSTTRIFSSAEKCRRVARRIFFTTCSAGSFAGTDFCLIFAPSKGYDEPEILPSSIRKICLRGADAGQPEGMIVAFSTQRDRTADDGTGRNSPYTAAFLKHIEESGEIGLIFRR